MLPDGFLIGAATAAHQVEGNNVHSDLWALEQMEHSSYVEPSLDAMDHYRRYAEDIALLASAGLDAYRFSLEWARIEPVEGQFDEGAIEHYRDVIRCCKTHGVEPIVTLMHFSSPFWLTEHGGWESDDTPRRFERYVEKIVSALGDDLGYVCTINEANIGFQIARITELFKRQAQAAQMKAASHDVSGSAAESNLQMGMNLQKMLEVRQLQEKECEQVFGCAVPQTFTSARSKHGDEIVMESHERARRIIRRVAPHVRVGLTLSLHDIVALPGGEQLAHKEWDEEYLHYLPVIEADDFLGVQNYTRSLVGPDGDQPAPEGAELTQAGYEYCPQALEGVIRSVAENFSAELMVTENGIATDDDSRRVAFISEALSGVDRCCADGIPVSGYMHWSLMDNFEWQLGFAMHFGLVHVDRETQCRVPKPSLEHLGSFAKRGH